MSLNTGGRLEKPSAQHLRFAAVFPQLDSKQRRQKACQLHQFNHFNATGLSYRKKDKTAISCPVLSMDLYRTFHILGKCIATSGTVPLY